MDLDVIARSFPPEILRLIASYTFKPVFQCHMCEEKFGYTGQYRFYSPCTNLGGSRKCQPIYVLYLSWDASIHNCSTICNRVYCGECISDCDIPTLIDETIQLNFFFGRQQVIVIEDYSSQFYDFRVIVMDMPKEHNPFVDAEQACRAIREHKLSKTFKGFCMYTVRLDSGTVIEAMNKVLTAQHRFYIPQLFEAGHLKYKDNYRAYFTDIYFNLRMLSGRNHSFSFWVENDIIHTLSNGRHSWTWNQERLLGHLFLSSHTIEWMTWQRLRAANIPMFPQGELEDFHLQYDGNLWHMPSHTTYRIHPVFLRPRAEDNFMDYLQYIYQSHPHGEDQEPWRRGQWDAPTLTISDGSDSDSDSDSTDQDTLYGIVSHVMNTRPVRHPIP